jgi:colanic acid biosynthesis glycosyl transferase WcaI
VRHVKILILGLNYLPESTSIGPYTADLAEYLHGQGHDVRVVTGFPTAPGWKVWRGYQGKLFMREVIHGVPVQRTWLYVPRDPRKTLGRILFDCWFAITSLAGALAGGRADVVIVVSPPLELAVTGWIAGAVFGARMFLHLQDLVPEAAVAVGALRSGSLAERLARALERFAYRRSDGIGVISEGMRRNLIAQGVPAGKVVTLPNSIDTDFVRPVKNGHGFRTRLGIGADEFLAMYSGSVGGKQGLETFVEAGAEFERAEGVTCCLIGDGPYLSALKETARQLALRRFRFCPLAPRESLAEQLSAADVLVLTQRKTVHDMSLPGKLLYYMAASRPILAAVSRESETAKFLREHEAGLVTPPEEPEALAEAIWWLRSHPEAARELGRNGRRAVEERFNRGVVLGQFAAHLEGRSA